MSRWNASTAYLLEDSTVDVSQALEAGRAYLSCPASEELGNWSSACYASASPFGSADQEFDPTIGLTEAIDPLARDYFSSPNFGSLLYPDIPLDQSLPPQLAGPDTIWSGGASSIQGRKYQRQIDQTEWYSTPAEHLHNDGDLPDEDPNSVLAKTTPESCSMKQVSTCSLSHIHSTTATPSPDSVANIYPNVRPATSSVVHDDSHRGPRSNSSLLPYCSEGQVCGINGCTKKFRRVCDLTKHSKTHRDRTRRRFLCTTCDDLVSFHYRKDLERHRRTVHKTEHDSPGHCCNVCSRTFIRLDKLVRHSKKVHGQ